MGAPFPFKGWLGGRAIAPSIRGHFLANQRRRATQSISFVPAGANSRLRGSNSLSTFIGEPLPEGPQARIDRQQAFPVEGRIAGSVQPFDQRRGERVELAYGKAFRHV